MDITIPQNLPEVLQRCRNLAPSSKVAFPGSAVETVFRKAEEEIGLRSVVVTALGAMEKLPQ